MSKKFRVYIGSYLISFQIGVIVMLMIAPVFFGGIMQYIFGLVIGLIIGIAFFAKFSGSPCPDSFFNLMVLPIMFYIDC